MSDALIEVLEQLASELLGRTDYEYVQSRSAPLADEIAKLPLYRTHSHPMLCKGGQTVAINPVYFAYTVAKCAVEHNSLRAAALARRVTSLKEVEVTCASLVSGVTTDRIVDAGKGVHIFPITDFQVPITQVQILNNLVQQTGATVIGAANQVLTPAIIESSQNGLPAGIRSHPADASEKVAKVIRLLTLMGPSAALGRGSWIQTLDFDIETVCPTAGFGVTDHEVKPMRGHMAAVEESISTIVERYNNLSEKSQRHIDISIGRLNLACRRMNGQDIALDAAIALESAIGGGNEKEEISYRLRMRSAWLIGGDLEAKVQTADIVKKLYNLRSKVVHTGQAIVKRDNDAAHKGVNLVSRLITRLLEIGGFPDWNVVELTGGTDLGTIS